MNEHEFQKNLGELIGQINKLPADQRAPLEELASLTRDRHEKMKKTMNDLQESLDYLRMSIKYLVFDLEATRRENEYLRKLIEQQNKAEDSDGQ